MKTATIVLSEDQLRFVRELLDNPQVQIPVKQSKIPSQVYDIFADVELLD